MEHIGKNVSNCSMWKTWEPSTDLPTWVILIYTGIICFVLNVCIPYLAAGVKALSKVMERNEKTKKNDSKNEDLNCDKWKEEIQKRIGIEKDILDLATGMENENAAKELLEIDEKWKVQLIAKIAKDEQHSWKKDLIKECESEWKGEILAKLESKEIATSIAGVKEEWRVTLIKNIPKNENWKIKMIEKAFSRDCALAIDKCDEEWKCQLLSCVTKDESWKISMIANCPFDNIVEFIFNAKDEDKAELISGTTSLWKLKLMITCFDEDPWKLENLSMCKYQWQGEMVVQCKTEDKARMITNMSTQWKANMLMQIDDDPALMRDNWKLNLLNGAAEYWRAELILKESRENVAVMIAKAATKKKAEAFSLLKNTEEWRLKALDEGANTDWKLKLVAETDMEVKAIAVNLCKMEGVGMLLEDVNEEWKLIAMSRCDEPWRAEVIKRSTDEWQARLILLCAPKDMEVWRVSKIPDIKDENIAVQYLFSPNKDKIPKWKFDLCIKISQEDSHLVTSKIETIFKYSQSMPEWKVIMIAELSDEEPWKVDLLEEVRIKAVAECMVVCKDENRARMVARCQSGWQATLVANAQEQWRASLLSDPYIPQWRALLVAEEGKEWKAGFLSKCDEEWRAQLIVEAQEEWKVNLLAKTSSKIKHTHMNDEWRYKLIAAADKEWKAISIGEVEEQWRAEMLARLPTTQEWKNNLIAYHSNGREEQWRLELVENLEEEWQVKMLLLSRSCTQMWKAKMIAKLGPKEQRRANELLECHTEEFALRVMDGEFDHWYV
jgi:hypothetical protein